MCTASRWRSGISISAMSGQRRLDSRARTREQLYEQVCLREGITRADLAQVTGLSRSTVNHAVTQLIAAKRVTEADAVAKGPGTGSGRPGRGLRAAVGQRHVAGIEFGHNRIQVAIADASGTPLAEERFEMGVDRSAKEAMDAAANIVAKLEAAHKGVEIVGVTAGIPGPIDSSTGLVRSPAILSSWVDLDPGAELARRIGVPVWTENDAYLGAYGERLCGAGQGLTDFLYVKASSGIGACPVIGGNPYRGASGLAGEIGHTLLAGRTDLCRCGNRGCLEAVVSAQAVREQIIHTHPGVDVDAIGLWVLDDAATRRILDEAGRTVGAVLADLVNLLNPSAIVLGGELGTSGPSFIEGVTSAIRRRAQPASAEAVKVVPAALGVRAELVGALKHAAHQARSLARQSLDA